MEPTQTLDPRSASSFQLPHLRWYICALLFFASTINYIDRQTISVLKPHLQNVLHWSESDYGWIVFAFQLAYALMLTVSGHFMDRLGTRLGYALAIVWWSIAAMAHALARGALSFGVARFFLGAGEAGNFPAAIKAVAEWFPKRERALATGIFNAGTNVGAVIAPPVVVWLTLKYSWQEAFIFTGALGFIWLFFWVGIYRLPQEHPWLAPQELRHIQSGDPEEGIEAAPKIPWRKILGYRQAWGFITAKFMTDPIWWFYVFWLPSYLKQARGFSLKEIGYFAWIPFLAADVGSVAGGWLSGFLMKRGWSVTRARKTAMAICAFCMPSGIVAVFAPNAWLALALISISTSAHQGWSANVFTLASDMFPKRDVGSVVGLGGTAGAAGGMILALTAGYILQWFHTYVPLFLIAGVMHPVAIGLVHLLVPKVEPVATQDSDVSRQ
jgi:ACS family hexuronate transporter-like MFS transporter